MTDDATSRFCEAKHEINRKSGSEGLSSLHTLGYTRPKVHMTLDEYERLVSLVPEPLKTSEGRPARRWSEIKAEMMARGDLTPESLARAKEVIDGEIAAANAALPTRDEIARALHAWDVEGGPCEGPWESLTDIQRDVWRSAADVVLALPRAESDHAFLQVNGHPDDDECTRRLDGTDATYCGKGRDEHG